MQTRFAKSRRGYRETHSRKVPLSHVEQPHGTTHAGFALSPRLGIGYGGTTQPQYSMW